MAVPEYVYYYDSGSLTVTPVPEPATYALFGVLAVGCLATAGGDPVESDQHV